VYPATRLVVSTREHRGGFRLPSTDSREGIGISIPNVLTGPRSAGKGGRTGSAKPKILSDKKRVVVTGFGLVTAVGNDEASFWSSLVAGRTGISKIRHCDLSANRVQNGGEVAIESFEANLPPQFRRSDRCLKFAFEASRQALTAAGRLTGPTVIPQDIGSIWGCGVGQSEMIEKAHACFFDKGPRGMRPSSIPNCMANSLAANISICFQLTGPNYVVASACTSATNAIGIGFRMISEGHAQSVLCGGAESPLSPGHYACWNNLGVLSAIPEPGRALRPFAVDRAGTLLGEGSGALVLESIDSARHRGARIRGEIVGYGESSDATHMIGQSVTGQARAIDAALRSAGIAPHSIGYINAHGTGTETNDDTESKAIRQVMGDATDKIPVGAMKSFFGHTLGASGAIEGIGTLLALETGIAPRNLNLDNPDLAGRLCLIGETSRPISSDYAIKSTFGFGGGNAVLVFRRYS
jgi:3-oxoacyl-[acyl-carrier-protein] synthase II